MSRKSLLHMVFLDISSTPRFRVAVYKNSASVISITNSPCNDVVIDAVLQYYIWCYIIKIYLYDVF